MFNRFSSLIAHEVDRQINLLFDATMELRVLITNKGRKVDAAYSSELFEILRKFTVIAKALMDLRTEVQIASVKTGDRAEESRSAVELSILMAMIDEAFRQCAITEVIHRPLVSDCLRLTK